MTELKYDPTKMIQLKDMLHSEATGAKFNEITMEKVVIGKM